MSDKEEELAKKIVEERLEKNKLLKESKTTIDNEIESILKNINSAFTKSIKEWYVFKEVDLNSANTIISNIDFGLTEKSKVDISAKYKTHPLNGKRSCFITGEYSMKLGEDDRYEYSDKIEFSLDNIILQSKFRKI